METKPSIQASRYTVRVIDGTEVLFDEEGFLIDPEKWTEAVAEALGREIGLPQLTDLQWEIVRFLRTYYFANGKAPMNKDIRKETGLKLMEIERLFPGGIRHGARRLAGLPNPKSC